MADYVVTAANVLASTSVQEQDGVAGVAITAGQALAINTSDGTMHLCSATAAAPLNQFAGIAQNNAAINQPVKYAKVDPSFTPGATMPAGDIVIVSATAGNLAHAADAVTGWFVTVVGVGIGTNQMNLGVAGGIAAGIAK